MNKRLERSFFPWVFFHTCEFWYYYVIALGSLWFLHSIQSKIPELAKDLGDKVLSGNIHEIELMPFVLIAIAILVFRTLSRLFFFYPARVQQKYLRMELMEKLELAHPSRYKAYNDGQIFQTLFNDFNRIRSLIGFALLQIGNIVFALVIFIPKIRDFNSDLLVAFIPLLVSVVLFSIVLYLFQPFVKKDIKLDGEVQNLLIETYEAKNTIKNFHCEQSFYDLFSKKSAYSLSYFFKASLGGILAFPLVKLGVGFSLLWGAYIIFKDDMGGTSLIFFSGFLFLVLEPLMFLSWIGVVFTSGYASWGRIKTLLKDIKIPSDEENDAKKYLISFEKHKINFWDKKIDIELKRGEWLIFTGDTGVGKSTVLRKISNNLTHLNISYSLVPQEPYLYNDTVMNNIFLGNEVTEEKIKLIKKYIEIFSLDILAQDVESVLSLEIGENGKRVSGGQAKRIALIRSLISDVDVYIWDDPFSSVDFILEKEILEILKNEESFKNKTFIFTSHRLSTIRYCDYVIILDQEVGILEEGQPRVLLKNKESKLSEHFEKQII